MIFSLIILLVVSRLGRARDTCSDFYVGDRNFTPRQNGLALFGTFTMMTSFVALSDQIAFHGRHGVLLAAGFAVSWLVTLLLVAEPLRNTGSYTLGDTLSLRMRARPVRVAAGTVTLVVSFFYMTIQLVAASNLLALLLGLETGAARALIVLTVAGLTAMTVYYGGMRGTTWTQIINAVLLLAAVLVLAGALLADYRFDVARLFGDAVNGATASSRNLSGPSLAGDGTPQPLELSSQLLTIMVGHAVLPYLFIRFLTVPNTRDVRRSVSWSIWLITPYYLLIVLIGFGAAALVPLGGLVAPSGQRSPTVSLLAGELGGVPMRVFIASVVFTTIVAVTAGLVLVAAASFTRDIHLNLANSLRGGEQHEVAVSRRAVMVICLLLAGGAILLVDANLAFLMSLDVTIAASSVFPALLFAWFWRRFNTVGALCCLYGGIAVTLVLVTFSPAVSGDPLALFPDADFAYLPWRHVGLVTIPVSFLLGYLGAVISAERDDAKYAMMQVRALTGVGAAEAVAAGPALPDSEGVPGVPARSRRRLPWQRHRY
ncbi:cation acetate symporter [Verrucosispora sp. WMMA2044]|uniref:solute symporter family protein n=1 Tax=Verrucosispora sp. WMMA2044 TaxID=3016419 RepID=UPI00248ACFAB|nr:cation acetate symporter [Verrucosispora sp. WMMA2044]WBB50436.1 cation acetate symporter [Verrucosispora sp. WMMA2044]